MVCRQRHAYAKSKLRRCRCGKVASTGTEAVSLREDERTSALCDAISEHRFVCAFPVKMISKSKETCMMVQVYIWNGNVAKDACDRYYLATRWINLHGISDVMMLRWANESYLKVLILNVASHASSAINSVAVNAFCRTQIDRVYGQFCAEESMASLHAHLSSVRAWKARLRFADSNTMNARSKNIRDIFALCERRPRGFDVYSSYVMYTV